MCVLLVCRHVADVDIALMNCALYGLARLSVTQQQGAAACINQHAVPLLLNVLRLEAKAYTLIVTQHEQTQAQQAQPRQASPSLKLQPRMQDCTNPNASQHTSSSTGPSPKPQRTPHVLGADPEEYKWQDHAALMSQVELSNPLLAINSQQQNATQIYDTCVQPQQLKLQQAAQPNGADCHADSNGSVPEAVVGNKDGSEGMLALWALLNLSTKSIGQVRQQRD